MEQVKAKSTALFALIQQFRNTDVPLRISAHMLAETGEKLTHYIQNPSVSATDKIRVLDELTEIIELKEWNRLSGEVPAGQVGEPEKVTVTAGATARTAADVVGSPDTWMKQHLKVVHVGDKPKTNGNHVQKVEVVTEQAQSKDPIEQMQNLLRQINQFPANKDGLRTELRKELAEQLRPQLADAARAAVALAKALKEIHDGLGKV